MESLIATLYKLFTTPFGPIVYDLIAVIFVIFFAWRGWKRGIFLELSGIISIVATYWLAEPAGRLLQNWLPLEHVPTMLHSITATTVGGIVVYLLLRINIATLIHFFSHDWKGMKNTIIRSLGALIGGTFGTLIALVLGLYILIIGGFSALMPQTPDEDFSISQLFLIPTHAAISHKDTFIRSQTGKLTNRINPFGSSGSMIENLPSVIPNVEGLEQLSENIESVTEILQEPEKIQEIIESEAAQEIMQQEAIQTLAENEEVRQMAQDGNIMGLMNHPAVIEAMEDPELMKALEGLDIGEMLK